MKRNNTGEDASRRNNRRPLQDITNATSAPEKIVGQKNKRQEGGEEEHIKKKRFTMNENETVMMDCTPLMNLKISAAEAIDVWKDEDQKKTTLEPHRLVTVVQPNSIIEDEVDCNNMNVSMENPCDSLLGQMGDEDERNYSAMGLGTLDTSNSNYMNTSMTTEEHVDLEEVEEEDVEEEDVNQVSIDDIDAVDAQDPIWASDYVVDVYNNLRNNENRNRITDYLSTIQTSLTADMRGILTDWLVEVSEEYGLSAETLFLTISYLDRFLNRVKVERTQFQLVGITAMLIASKFEEVTPPSITDFVNICADAYKKSDIVDMEVAILNALSFNLVHATPKAFVRRFLKAATADMLLAFLVNYIIELSISEYVYTSVLPSMIAAAAVCLGLMILGREAWTPSLQHHTGYSLADDEFNQCIYNLYLTFQRAPARRQRAVVEKYKQEKFLQVSLITAPEGLMGELD